MRRISLAVIAAALVAAPSALARHERIAGVVFRGPTVAEQHDALRLARVYWRHHGHGLSVDGNPRCGTPRIVWRTIADGGAADAWTNGTCVIDFDPETWFRWPVERGAQSDAWVSFCFTVVHEVGHLILGPSYFAATNPSDPAHSPDPHSVMYPQDIGQYPGVCRAPDPSH